MRPSLDASAWRALQRHVLELEHERSEARERADLLTSLHRAFAGIVVTRGPQAILERTLRAAFDPLGFSRAIFFTVETPARITARQQLDGGDAIEIIDEPASDRPGNALFAVASGDLEHDVGTSRDLSSPLVDCRGWYAIARLDAGRHAAGLLYVDGHRHPEPHEPETSLVRSLAAIAGVAIDNATLFAETQRLAERDPLTNLLNRRAFAARAAGELERCKRERRAAAFAVIDVDDFKSVNDAHGHAFGDAVLTRVARTLARCSRPQDVVGRFAGDEFVVLFTGIDAALGYALVARLSSELRSAELRCSIGAALYPHGGADADALFLAADRALYRTKAGGKNGFTFA
jgi:diguanylate cyclase (GGDEF)-like protein